MATRYWVGGAGTWDSSSTTHWSATSGGASGASAPTSADDARFDTNSGASGTVTIASGAVCRILTWHSTTLTMGGSANITIYRTFDIETGSIITYSGTMTVSYGFGTSFIAGVTIPFNVTFVNTGSGNWSPSFYDPVFSGTVTLTSGTIDLSGFTMTVAQFLSSNSNTRNLTLGTGNFVVTGSGTSFNVSTSTGFTTDSTGTIKMSSSSAKTFAGGGASYPTLSQTGTGALTISGSNTFVSISNTVQPTTITFTSGTTQTFTSNFALSGTAGNLVTIGATTTSAATLSKSSGTISVSHCSISYSTATGGASWKSLLANGNVNGGNNSGWMFTVGAGKFFQLF